MRKKIKQAFQRAPENMKLFGKAYGEKVFVAPLRDAVTNERVFRRQTMQPWAEGMRQHQQSTQPQPGSPDWENLRNLDLLKKKGKNRYA